MSSKTSYRNAAHAFHGKLNEALTEGELIQVRGSLTRELRTQTISLQRPFERCIVLPHRLGSIAACVAETVWVIAGRDDIDFLSDYLPRAAEFSDDGTTWSGAYGPRLRDWMGIDQVAQIRELLLADPTSRRAVMSIFDPAQDFNSGLDVPCNNWLNFTIRNGCLDLSVAIRSNDLIWGFSGINTFEWSVLHEMMAHWLDVKVGQAHYFISSLHLYERHFERAEAIVSAPRTSSYERGYASIPYQGSWEDLSSHLEHWFKVESQIRRDPWGSISAIDEFPEPMLRSFLHAVRGHWALLEGGGDAGSLVVDSEADVSDAIAERGSRTGVIAWHSGSSTAKHGSLEDLRNEIVALHREKSAAYGDSWKRRGEQFSIIPNVARKIDRLERIEAGHPAGTEPVYETLLDLFVYLVKYQTFLAEPTESHTPTELLSDGTSGFEQLLSQIQPDPNAGTAVDLAERFNTYVTQVDSMASKDREIAVRALSESALSILLAIGPGS